ncbi:DUF1453 family protein [Streptomyces turgidiscabies]|uniref:Integral membrane protein n=1 Tax=Streptomyces turgidiscabies (strain Car8) TaxID=698760 RepID=L7FGC3_STRT8|nr:MULTISPECIES: DUF1453 family protein [Streptomyces]ELP70458.1 hypothetical protein STRTUCAR8_08075 [Streptomyces turgidiscabies Car8]MDX3498543.1 DUF1453 family protein [Streptomyces turgidiscabies]GAQ73658.1 hypothetical protein T45_05418 [Streptomyces turgidiscabies]
MSGLADVLLIVAVVALVVVRQFRTRRIDTDRRWWVVPVILAVVALREPGLVDIHHRTESITLLAVELLIGLATGAGWAWTTRIWAEPDGEVWSRSTRASVAVWVVGIGLRAGLFALGAALGVHQDTSALLLALAATLLLRAGILHWRVQSLHLVSPHAELPHPASAPSAHGRTPAYGDGVRSRKERV